MFDCSRNAVPLVETFHNLLVYCTLFGINTMLMYTEDVYEASRRYLAQKAVNTST